MSTPLAKLELHNKVVQLSRRAEGGIVEIDDLPDELRTPGGCLGMPEPAEQEAVAEALRAAGGNRSQAAQALGIVRNTLYRSPPACRQPRWRCRMPGPAALPKLTVPTRADPKSRSGGPSARAAPAHPRRDSADRSIGVASIKVVCDRPGDGRDVV